MKNGLEHLVIAPVLLPLAVAAAMLLFNEKRRRLKQTLSVLTAGTLIVIAAALLGYVSQSELGDSGFSRIYRLGNWPAPFGITLVADRLSVMMLLLASVIGFSSLLYATAHWDRSGPRFHSLFLFLLMGVNGAFLTGDIFNLFVFFEVLLAASYGLALHGSGGSRTKAGLHYVVINIATSLLFLVGISMIYSITGTLNLADISRVIPDISANDVPLFQSGLAILAIVFFVKAGIWPLGFWLPQTYGAASPPAAASFAILTKVGIYILLRLSSLLLPEHSTFAVSAENLFKYAGIATMTFGIVSLVSAPTLVRVSGAYLIISSGTLLAAMGFGGIPVIAGLLFYLVASTLGTSAMYLIIEPVERNTVVKKSGDSPRISFDSEYVGGPEEEDRETEIGVAITGTVALLGGGFILVALLMSGLPPLPGFVGKFALMHGLLQESEVDVLIWIYISLMVLSGLAALIATTRTGIELLWKPVDRPMIHLNILEAAPIGLLLASSIILVGWSGPVFSFMEKTAQELNHPASYVNAVLGPHETGRNAR